MGIKNEEVLAIPNQTVPQATQISLAANCEGVKVTNGFPEVPFGPHGFRKTIEVTAPTVFRMTDITL